MHGCDPGIKLNNHFNVDKLPFIDRKNKSKISAVAGLMNNSGRKIVKLDSPFSENFNAETVNKHPAIYNPSVLNNQTEHPKKNNLKEKKENVNEKTKTSIKKNDSKRTKTNGKFLFIQKFLEKQKRKKVKKISNFIQIKSILII